MATNLQPLRFRPRFVEKMWGGRRLQDVLGKDLPSAAPFGESWEVYDFPPGAVGADGRAEGDDPHGWTSARLDDGRTLHDLMVGDSRALLGDARPVDTPHGPQFPLLIKFLDAHDDLSVQVHPSPEYARAHADAHLKNECWHALAVDKGSRLLVGVRPGVDAGEFRASLDDGTCEQKLNRVAFAVGDTIYLPSGTVHALGRGVLAAEVQTPSDTTFRVYDFDRPDPKTGKPRALHVEPALACIDFAAARPPVRRGPGRVVDAPQFTLDAVTTAQPRRLARGRPTVLMGLSGTARVGAEALKKGATIVVPASWDGEVVPAGEASYLVAVPTA